MVRHVGSDGWVMGMVCRGMVGRVGVDELVKTGMGVGRCGWCVIVYSE